MSKIDQEALRSVVEKVLADLGRTPAAPVAAAPAPEAKKDCGCSCKGSGGGENGVFGCVDKAAEAANDAFLKLKKLGIEGRTRAIEIVKGLCAANTEAWGKFEMNETKIGRLDHKIGKLEIMNKVPGVEWLRPYAMSGDGGITLEEYAPYGVVGAILPVTHSVPTLTGNVINMVAAGNAIVFNPHPGGAKSAAMAVKAYNKAIHRELGIDNLICTIEDPSIESFNLICQNEQIAIMAITGGPAVVNAAMKSGKRAICAGPGNPVVVIDETADLARAARCIIEGASFDNNLLCIGEKVVFVVSAVFNQFMAEMERAGAGRLDSAQIDRLTKAAFTYKEDDGGCSHAAVNRELIGADPGVLAAKAGASIPKGCPLLFGETSADHPYVQEEQMMPMIPIVSVPDFETAVQLAKQAEHGYRHSAIIHSQNVRHMTHMGKEMDTTIFVKNGACVAGLGLGGEGYLSYSIATTTGEGITTPKTFTRVRRCVLVEDLRII
ncbi:MAG: aldehyde dehydrogenase EutE [Verrucomicrobia bacterium]|nr:aldehyde dehydrogenase EutE [Verrucomicrobiota bacterium]MDA1005632.1 aldehyde dehydrogenase EutE [Verrucomicrobiota bacterium]